MTEFEDIERWGKPQPIEVPEVPSRKKTRLPVALYSFLALLGLSILAFSLYYAFIKNSETEIDTAGQSASTQSPTSVEPEPAKETDATTVTEENDDPDSKATDPNVTVLDLKLLSGKGDPDNVGTAILEINAETGKVCYELDTKSFPGPSRSHIHVGTADITGGDIILELDSQDSYPAKDCVQRDTRDIEAILTNLPGHYIELHSPKNEQGEETDSVRSQLGEGESTASSSDLVDAEDGEATTIIEKNSIVLQGNVADQQTVDRLVNGYKDVNMGNLTVINKLKIVPGSPAPTGKIEISDAILFEKNSAELNQFEGTVLENFATLLKARPDWKVSIVGHTDSRGSDVLNLELSKRRANAVRSAFEETGLDGERFITRGAGFRDPVASNETEEGRAQNRRITLEVTP